MDLGRHVAAADARGVAARLRAAADDVERERARVTALAEGARWRSQAASLARCELTGSLSLAGRAAGEARVAASLLEALAGPEAP